MMPNLPISQLPSVGNTGYTESDILVFVNYQIETGTTSNTPLSQVKEWVLSGLSENYLPLSGGTVSGDTIFQSGLTATTISATTYLNLPGRYEKIVLRKVDLGSRGNVANVWQNLSLTLCQREIYDILNNPNYTGSKIDYYFTVNDTDTLQRKKILWTTQTIGFDFNSLAFQDLCDFIDNTYGDVIVNFYCEVYILLDNEYSPPTQMKLVNPLYSSLNSNNYSLHRKYTGEQQFIRNTFNDQGDPNNYNSNTIYSNFIDDRRIDYYDADISEDIPKKIYNIVNQPNFYGELSGNAQTVINVGTWDQDVREVVKKSVYVEPAKKFYSKFKIPTNLNGFNTVDLKRLNNFYGNLLYDIGGGNPLIYNTNADTTAYSSTTAGQFIDTYKLYPKGDKGFIFFSADTEPQTHLNDLSYSVGSSRFSKYFSKNESGGTYREFGSYLQVLPGISDTYSLKINFSGNPTLSETQNFVNNIFQNYVILNDYSVNKNNITWHSITGGTSNLLYSGISQGEIPVVTATTFDNIIIGGSFSYFNGDNNNNVVGLLTGGTQDFDFDFGGGFNQKGSGFGDKVYVITKQSNGKILVGGSFNSYNDYLGLSSCNQICRLNSDGTFDNTFNSGGTGFDSVVFSIYVLTNGKILVGGQFTTYTDNTGTYNCEYIARLNSDGTFDQTFNSGGIGFNGSVHIIDVQSDGKIVCGGQFDQYIDSGGTYTMSKISRLNSDGTFDASFNNGGIGFNNTVFSIKVLSSGSILVGGVFTVFEDLNGVYFSYYFTKLNSDGTLDTSFNNGGTGFDEFVYTIDVQSDGKILCGGTFTSYDDSGGSNSMRAIARLNSDGTFDDTFNAGGVGFINDVKNIKIQQDGKILVAGDLISYEDNIGVFNIGNIARLNSNGTFDNTFENGLGIGFNGEIESIYIQTDGKILCGGSFSSYDDSNNNYYGENIARLNTDGTFNYGNGPFGNVYAVEAQPDGKILVGGDFYLFTDSTGTYKINNILRLNQNGTLDQTFLNGNIYGFNGTVFTIAIQSDGKILVGGEFNNYQDTGGSNLKTGICRLNSDGSFDSTFNNGSVGFIGSPAIVYDIKIQTNGKILCGGYFGSYEDSNGIFTKRKICRLNSDGTFDQGFDLTGNGFATNDQVFTIAIQNDGKILVGGELTFFDGGGNTYDLNNICRLDANGAMDSTFLIGNTYGPNSRVYSIDLTQNQKIICVGEFGIYSDNIDDYESSGIAKLNHDGTFDTTFNNGINYGFPLAKYGCQDVKIQPDGKILVGGDFVEYTDSLGTHSVYSIARLTSDGLFDSTFNSGNLGIETLNPVYKISLLFNEQTGLTIPYGNILIQSNDEKMLELSQNPVFTYTSITENKIFVGGAFMNYEDNTAQYNQQFITSLNTDGTYDINFNSGGLGFNDEVWATAVQNDGKLVCGGIFGLYVDIDGTHSMNNISRLNSDGTFDQTFNNGGVGFNGTVRTLAIQNDGKILVGGDFFEYSDSGGTYTCYYIARLNSDGTFDQTFNNGGGGFENSVYSISIQSDGKILCGGSFVGYNDVSGNNFMNYIIRLNSNGTFDSTFNNGGSGFDFPPRNIAIQSDGKILVGGDFNEFSDINGSYLCLFIARLNSNGTFDTTFQYGAGIGFDSTVYCISIQSNGKILIGGQFSQYYDNISAYDCNNIARLNIDGTFDTSFVHNILSTNFNGSVAAIKVQSNNKILCGGSFNLYTDNTGIYNCEYIARLNSDGTFDQTFNSGGIGFDNLVYTISQSTDSITTNTISIDAIYKGHSFRPLIYPLNLTQLLLEVPESFFYDGSELQPSKNSNNNLFEFVDDDIVNKKLCLIINYKKLNKYDIIQENLVYTIKRGTNNIFMMMVQNVERTVINYVSKSKMKHFRPGGVEISFAFMDLNTYTISKIPNYKMIVTNYGDNEIFKLVRDILK